LIKRAAFASSDGDFVNYHFGRANTFFVYDIGGPSNPSALAGKRRCYRIPGQGRIEQGIAHQPEELERTAKLLADCDAIFVVRIGDGPAKFFIERGFRVFQLSERIDDIIEEIVRANELEESAL
jgi:predicted Fe-Mo cluster-binding NifX family protein